MTAVLLLLALMLAACNSTDPADSLVAPPGEDPPGEDSIDYAKDSIATKVKAASTYLMSSISLQIRRDGYTQIEVIDFSTCTIKNGCLVLVQASSPRYLVTKTDSGIFVETSALNNRLTDPTFKAAWTRERVPGFLTGEASLNPALYTRVFDESPKCLNIESPSMDAQGETKTPVKASTPCLPYWYASELPGV